MRDQRDPHKPLYDRRRRTARTGRVGFDSVGNPYWQDADDRSDPLRLDNPALALAADEPLPGRPVENPSGKTSGYNPYGSGLLTRRDVPGRQRDLRALSNWIQSKRRVTDNQD